MIKAITAVNASVNGKNTYIVVSATILYCVLGVLLRFMTIPAAIAAIGGLGAIGTLRMGVAKAQGVLDIILETLKLIGQQTPVVNPGTPTIDTTIPPTA